MTQPTDIAPFLCVTGLDDQLRSPLRGSLLRADGAHAARFWLSNTLENVTRAPEAVILDGESAITDPANIERLLAEPLLEHAPIYLWWHGGFQRFASLRETNQASITHLQFLCELRGVRHFVSDRAMIHVLAFELRVPFERIWLAHGPFDVSPPPSGDSTPEIVGLACASDPASFQTFVEVVESVRRALPDLPIRARWTGEHGVAGQTNPAIEHLDASDSRPLLGPCSLAIACGATGEATTGLTQAAIAQSRPYVVLSNHSLALDLPAALVASSVHNMIDRLVSLCRGEEVDLAVEYETLRRRYSLERVLSRFSERADIEFEMPLPDSDYMETTNSAMRRYATLFRRSESRLQSIQRESDDLGEFQKLVEYLANNQDPLYAGCASYVAIEIGKKRLESGAESRFYKKFKKLRRNPRAFARDALVNLSKRV